MKYRLKFIEGIGYYPQVELRSLFFFKDWYTLHKVQGRLRELSKENRDYPYVDKKRAKQICEEHYANHKKNTQKPVYINYRTRDSLS